MNSNSAYQPDPERNLTPGSQGRRFGPWFEASFSRFAAISTTLCLQFYLARNLGATEYGIYLFAIANSLVLASACLRGADTLTVRWASIYNSQKSPVLLASYIRFISHRVISGGLCGLLLAWIVTAIAAASGHKATYALLLASPLTLISCLTRVAEASIRAEGKTTRGALSTWGTPLTTMLGVVLCHFYGEFSLGPNNVIAIQVIAATAFCFISLAANRDKLNHRSLSLRDGIEYKKWINDFRPMTFFAAASALQAHGVLLLTGWILGPEPTSLLGISLRVATLLCLGSEAANLVMGPRFSSEHAAKDKSLLVKSVRQTTIFSTSIALCGLVIIFAYTRDLLQLLGIDYLAADSSLLLLSLTMTACVLAGPADLLLNMTGNARTTLKVSVISSIIGISIAIAAMPSLGHFGAAIGQAVGLIVRSTLLAVMCLRRLRVKTNITCIFSPNLGELSTKEIASKRSAA